MAAKHRLVALVLMAGTCGLLPTLSAADPIIPNASFSLGNSGFASGYRHVSSPTLPDPLLMWYEGTYTVGASPDQYHGLWTGFGDHTTGDGGMLIVNGSSSAGVTVWSVTVDVEADTEYDFSAWAASVYPANPASLALSINGTVMEAPFLLPSGTGMWQRFSALWYSGDGTTARLSLVGLNTVLHGNDFALDDIALTAVRRFAPFSSEPGDPGGPGDPGEPGDPGDLRYRADTPAPVPEPGSMLLFGSGLAGLAGYVKKRNVKKAS